MLLVHLVAEPAGDRDEHQRRTQDRLDRRILGAGLHLEPHPLLLELHVGLDAGAPLGLFQPELLFAQPRLLLFFGAAEPLFLGTADAFFFFARGALGRFPGGPLGFAPRRQLVLLALNAIVLEPTQLLQRKKDGILTPFGHGSPLLTRFVHQLKPAPGAGAAHLNDASSLSIAALSRVDFGPLGFLSSAPLLATVAAAPLPFAALALP